MSNLIASVMSQSASLTVTAPYDFVPLAGFPLQSGNADGVGSVARFNSPYAVAVDTFSNTYVCDFGNHTIRKIAPGGLVTTLAGSPGVYGTNDGVGSVARFYYPDGIAVDSSGNIYVSDSGNYTIRKIDTNGVVTTIAGSPGHYGSADGTGSAARFLWPMQLAIDISGNIYVADSGNYEIRKVTQVGTNWVVSTLPGGFGYIEGVAVDNIGNVYVAEYGGAAINKLTPVGTNWESSTIAGSQGIRGYSDGIGSTALFNTPANLAVDASGNIFVTDYGNAVIRKLTPLGTNYVVTTVAGTSGNHGTNPGAGDAALFESPLGLAMDNQGNLYVSDTGMQTILMGIPANLLPTIVVQPQSFTESAGYGASFNVVAGGQTPITFQWYQNGTAISGATNGTYSINALLMTDAGTYFVIASNAIGTATSSNATLTVSVPYVFATLAGLPGSRGSVDGSGNSARFSAPSGVTVDTAGNIYVEDTDNYTIRKITPAGVVTTLAGQSGYSGYADGTGNGALFSTFAYSLAADTNGNLYVSDMGNMRIRKVTPTGVVTTLAGNGAAAEMDGTGTNAEFNYPIGVAVDNAGNVFVSDLYGNTLRKITPAGAVTTLASLPGNNQITFGYFDYGGFNPLAVDNAGNIYVGCVNSAIYKVSANEVENTLAGWPGSGGTTDGIATAARFGTPGGIAVDSAGNIYVVDTFSYSIRKITPAGIVTTIAGLVGSEGNSDGTGTNAQFNLASAIAVDSSGTLYVADHANSTIRVGVPANSLPKIVVQPQSFTESATYGATFSVVAVGQTPMYYQWYKNGTAIPGSTNATFSINPLQLSDGGTYAVIASNLLGAATSSNAVLSVNAPYSITTLTSSGVGIPNGAVVDAAGNIYTASSSVILKVTTAGAVTTLAGSSGSTGSADGVGSAARFNGPMGVAADAVGNIYVADTVNNTIREVTPAGLVTTLAGSAGVAGSLDGMGTNALFKNPIALAVDAIGNIYVSDSGNNTIRKVTPAGAVSTLAGMAGQLGFSDGFGTAARFYSPEGMAVDSAGNVFVADTYNNLVRKINPFGMVTTLAGSPSAGVLTDGTGSAAEFIRPAGLTIDSADNVYITTYDAYVKKITPAGVVTTLAGDGRGYMIIDGTGSAAQFWFQTQASGLAIGTAGNLYIIDSYNGAIRLGLPPSPFITGQPQSQLALAGSTITLAATVSGVSPLNYQWQFNGTNVSGATNVTLRLSTITSALSGAYNLVISNSYGSITSAVVNVSAKARWSTREISTRLGSPPTRLMWCPLTLSLAIWLFNPGSRCCSMGPTA